MIGVVVPAHNEEGCLDACLHALRRCATHPALNREAVVIQVVLDDCSDASLAIAKWYSGAFQGTVSVGLLQVAARNVGAARGAGANLLLARGARWLAFTDADSRVGPGWLAAQLGLGADAVCGSVAVDDWSPHAHQANHMRDHFARTYNDADGHRHIHGANLGVSAAAYRAAGGFPPLTCSEDVALVEALQRNGARIAWSAAPRVITSARRDARARGGFGDTLLAVLDARP